LKGKKYFFKDLILFIFAPNDLLYHILFNIEGLDVIQVGPFCISQ